MTEITYMTVNGIQLPNLSLPETEPIGRHGRLRQRYLKEQRPSCGNQMVLNGTLWPHLHRDRNGGAEPHRPDAAEAGGGSGRNRGAGKPPTR